MRSRNTLTAHAASFDRAADVYEAARPPYPAEAVDWLVPAGARRVLDLGAGTGKLTRLLAADGRALVAVDPSPAMLRVLHDLLPDVGIAVGTAEQIPLPDASVDAITVAQAWHWVDPARAVPEVARVLRPGGTLGLIWNLRDERVGWVAELSAIMRAEDALFDGADDRPPIGPPFDAGERASVAWTYPLTRAGLRDLVRSRSYVIVRPDDEQRAILAAVDDLLAGHPQLTGRDTIDMPYVTECFRYRRA